MATPVKQKPAKRRIEYIELYYLDTDKNKIVLDIAIMKKIMNYMKKIQSDFEYNDINKSRWYGIDNIIVNSSSVEIILKNCVYQYTPNIIDIFTKSESPSPKNINQGDKEITHFLFKDNNLLVEKMRNGTPLSIFLKYVNQAIVDIDDLDIKKIYSSIIMVDEFMDLFEKSTRIKNVNITLDKSHKLDEFSKFHKDDNVRETYSLEYKAKRSKSINKETIRYYVDNFIDGSKFVEKITMDIDNEDEDSMRINTDEFSKHNYLDVPKDKNGVIISEIIFREMSNL